MSSRRFMIILSSWATAIALIGHFAGHAWQALQTWLAEPKVAAQAREAIWG